MLHVLAVDTGTSWLTVMLAVVAAVQTIALAAIGAWTARKQGVKKRAEDAAAALEVAQLVDERRKR